MKFNYCESDGIDIFNGIRERMLIRSRIGGEVREFNSSAFSESMDAFGATELKVWYDGQNFITGAEIIGNSEFWLLGQNLIGVTVEYLKKFLSSHGFLIYIPDEGIEITIKKDSVRFYVPSMPELGNLAVVESIYVSV